MTPLEVHARLLEGISAGRFEELADLYAEDAVVDMPLALPSPRRLEGRETIRKHFAAAGRGPLTFKAHNVVAHRTTDPEVIVVEFGYEGHVATNGRTFHAANVQVMRVHNGLIVWSRDYHDHAAIAAALTP